MKCQLAEDLHSENLNVLIIGLISGGRGGGGGEGGRGGGGSGEAEILSNALEPPPSASERQTEKRPKRRAPE